MPLILGGRVPGNQLIASVKIIFSTAAGGAHPRRQFAGRADPHDELPGLDNATAPRVTALRMLLRSLDHLPGASVMHRLRRGGKAPMWLTR
jgi:hypothetical protein